MKSFTVPSVIGGIKLTLSLFIFLLFPTTRYPEGEGSIRILLQELCLLVLSFFGRFLRATRHQKDKNAAQTTEHSSGLPANSWLSHLHGFEVGDSD